MIFAGALTETLEFFEVVSEQSKSDKEVYRFSCRAERMKSNQKYLIDGHEIYHYTSLQFRCRYRSDVKETWIVVYDGERYRITALDINKIGCEMIITMDKIND